MYARQASLLPAWKRHTLDPDIADRHLNILGLFLLLKYKLLDDCQLILEVATNWSPYNKSGLDMRTIEFCQYVNLQLKSAQTLDT